MSSSNYSWVQLKFGELCYRKKHSELGLHQEQEGGSLFHLSHVALQRGHFIRTRGWMKLPQTLLLCLGLDRNVFYIILKSAFEQGFEPSALPLDRFSGANADVT